MNKLALKSKIAKFPLFAIAFFSLLLSAFATANAQTTTFAQFFERVGGQDFVFTNQTTSANFNTVSGGSPIFFIYQNINNLSPSLQGIQDAHLFITTTTTQSGANNSGTLTQPLNQIVTVQIIRDTPAPMGVGSGSRTNLLTAVFSPVSGTPTITGSGSSATLSATTPDHVVTFSSDFLGFNLTSQRNLAFSFSSVTPALSLGAGNFLQNFTAAGSGTFASNPVPIYLVPTAASASISGRISTAQGNGLRNAKVILTEADGTTHRTATGAFGYFNFDNIEVGQTVTVQVISKRYTFAPKIVQFDNNIGDLDFIAEF